MRIRFLQFLLIVSATLGASSGIVGQDRVPQFKTYAVSDIYSGKNAAPIISGDDERRFRTRLREAAKGKANFAGRFILSAWGCGASCLMGAVIDARSGKVYWLPHTTCCWSGGDDNFNPIEFRLNSRLIIFSGLRNESENDSEDDTHFYEFRDGRFVFIKTVKRGSN